MASGTEPGSSERRKLRKIVVERRRRERIDRCLEHLRLILQADAAASTTSTANSSSSTNPGFGDGKLEKADILEKTVSYLHLLTQHRAAETARGYAACLQEVDNFLNKEAPHCKGAFRAQLLARLHHQAGLLLPHTTVLQDLEKTPDVTSSGSLADRKRQRKPLQRIENTSFSNCMHINQGFQGSGSSGRGLYNGAADVTDGGIFSSNHVTKRRCLDGSTFDVRSKRQFPQGDSAKSEFESMSTGSCENQVNPCYKKTLRASVVDEPRSVKTSYTASGVFKYDRGLGTCNILRRKPQSRVVVETVSKTETETGSIVETETGSKLEIESEIRVGTEAEIDRSDAVVTTVCVNDCSAEYQDQEQEAPETEIGRLSVQHDGERQINDQSFDNHRNATPNPKSERGISSGISHRDSPGISHGISSGISHGISPGISHGISPGISHGISTDLLNFWRPWHPWTQ